MFILAETELGKSRHSVRMMHNDVIMTFKDVQGHRCRYQSKAHIRLPISD